MTVLDLKDDRRDRAPVHGERLRHLPAPANVQGVPRELDEAARVEKLHAAAGVVEGLRAARAADLPCLRAGERQLHWNNFLWPLIITNSVESRPVTSGVAGLLATGPGIDWSIIGGDAAHVGAAAGGLSALSTAIRPIVRRAGIGNCAMKLVTWNVQWCRGVDQKVDPGRVAEAAPRRFRCALPARLPTTIGSSVGRKRGRRPVRAPCVLLPAIPRFPASRSTRWRRWSPPSLRQHDPVAAAGQAGVRHAALSCRSMCRACRASQSRRWSSGVRRRTGDHHASRVLLARNVRRK